MIKLHSRNQRLDEAHRVAQDLPKKWGFSLSDGARSCLIEQCVRRNELDQAMRVMQDMKAAGGGSMDGRLFGIFTMALVRSGSYDEAASLVEDAYGLQGKKRMMPSSQDIPYNALQLVSRNIQSTGRWRVASEFLITRMREVGTQAWDASSGRSPQQAPRSGPRTAATSRA